MGCGDARGPWMVPGREEVGWGKAGELAEPGEGLLSLWGSPAPTGHPDLSCKWAVGLMVGTRMDRGRNCPAPGQLSARAGSPHRFSSIKASSLRDLGEPYQTPFIQSRPTPWARLTLGPSQGSVGAEQPLWPHPLNARSTPSVTARCPQPSPSVHWGQSLPGTGTRNEREQVPPRLPKGTGSGK